MLANIRPGGRYLMEDFYYAGGLRALLVRLGDLTDADRSTVTGRSMARGARPEPRSSTTT